MLIEAYRDARRQIPTYAEVDSLPSNSGLPEGAVRVHDPTVDELLRREKIAEIQRYKETRVCGDHRSTLNTVSHLLKGAFRVGESGFDNSTFNNELCPKVEGISWYRGFSFQSEKTDGEVFIFCGWMQPWYEGGAPDFMVYTRGKLNGLDVFVVVKTYCEVSRALRENPPLPSEEN